MGRCIKREILVVMCEPVGGEDGANPCDLIENEKTTDKINLFCQWFKMQKQKSRADVLNSNRFDQCFRHISEFGGLNLQNFTVKTV